MGHEQPKACLAPQVFEARHRLAPPRDKPDALSAEGGLEVRKAFGLKRRVARIPFGLREHLRLVNKQGQHGAAPGPGHGLRERGVIVHAEIALQPDTDGRGGVGHDDHILFTQDPCPAKDTWQIPGRSIGPHPIRRRSWDVLGGGPQPCLSVTTRPSRSHFFWAISRR